MSQIPIAADLFTWPSDDPRLWGSRCTQCGTRAFPVPPACVRCTSTDVEFVELSGTGTVWTWTSQEFRPPSPPYTGRESFERYFVGYVLLPDEVHVEAHLVGYEDRTPQIGDEVELVIIPFTLDADGNEIMIHAFQPAGSTKERTHG